MEYVLKYMFLGFMIIYQGTCQSTRGKRTKHWKPFQRILLFTSIQLYIIFLLRPISRSLSLEYCNGDVIEASCDSNEVMTVDAAYYGRMRIGKCVKRDLGHLGCRNDAIEFMDRECSGRSSCRVTVSNRLQTENACEEELAGYAEVTYSCHKGQAHKIAKSHEKVRTWKSKIS